MSDSWQATLEEAMDRICGTDTSRHRDGMAWHEAPIPPIFHRCKAQTEGGIGLVGINRCACGAMKLYGMHNTRWKDRNSRRIHQWREKWHRS